ISVTVPLGPSRSPSQAETDALDITTAATAPKTACLASKSGPKESEGQHAGDCGENPVPMGSSPPLLRARHRGCYQRRMLAEGIVYLLSLRQTPPAFRRHLVDAVGLWARGRRQARA